MSIKTKLILGYLIALILSMISIPVMLFLSYVFGAIMFSTGLFTMILTLTFVVVLPQPKV